MFLDDGDDAGPIAAPDPDPPLTQIGANPSTLPSPVMVPQFISVQFHPWRTQFVRNTSGLPLNVGDFVITAAERGCDLGRVVSTTDVPTEHEAMAAKAVLRLASPQEVASLPAKSDREASARTVCQEKANELGLPMSVTATEFQFDGKKLTVYFSANQYVDFRSLVHTLFRVFGTRIWMVWHDGDGPVRDIFTHGSDHE